MSEQTHACVEVTDATFDEQVLKSPLPVVVDFWAQWCGPCRYIAPLLEKLAAEFKDRLVIAKVNVDQSNERFQALGLRSIPTLLFYHCGELVATETGSRSYPELRQLFIDFITKAEETPCQVATDEIETAFSQAVSEADAAFEAVAEPAREQFETEIDPHKAVYETAVADADGRLAREEISDSDREGLVQTALAQFKADTKAAVARLKALLGPAEELRTAAIDAARRLFEESRNVTPAAS